MRMNQEYLHVYLPVVWAQRRIRGNPLGAFPAHEIPLQLFHRLQRLPLTGKQLHLTAWTTGQRDWVLKAKGMREVRWKRV